MKRVAVVIASRANYGRCKSLLLALEESRSIVLYLIIWWLSLFLFLPLGITSSKNVKKGNDPGAPEEPKIKKKFFMTTLFSLLIWLIIYLISKVIG